MLPRGHRLSLLLLFIVRSVSRRATRRRQLRHREAMVESSYRSKIHAGLCEGRDLEPVAGYRAEIPRERLFRLGRSATAA